METLKEEVNSKNNALKKNKDNKEKNQEIKTKNRKKLLHIIKLYKATFSVSYF